jgi:hypothetical protein
MPLSLKEEPLASQPWHKHQPAQLLQRAAVGRGVGAQLAAANFLFWTDHPPIEERLAEP